MDIAHDFERGALECDVHRLENELASARAEIERLDWERGQACYDRDSARSVVKAWEQQATDARADVERLTRELEEMRETMHSQAGCPRSGRIAQQRILMLEVENLRLKRLLSPVEEG